MKRFRGKTENGQPRVKWRGPDGITAECAKHHDFIIEVRPYDKAAEISRQQMAYYHTIPVKAYSDHTGNSLWYSDQELKRQCGAEWFMLEWNEEEHRSGRTFFMCMSPNCRLMMLAPGRSESGYVCRSCGQGNLKPFFMLSKTELTVNKFSDYLENIWMFMEGINCPCPRPNKDWRINRKKGKQ